MIDKPLIPLHPQSCLHLDDRVGRLLLALETPLSDPHAPLPTFLHAADVVVCVLFGAELLLKSVALGLYGHPRAYLSDRWNVLDAAIVLTSAAALLLPLLQVIRGQGPKTGEPRPLEPRGGCSALEAAGFERLSGSARLVPGPGDEARWNARSFSKDRLWCSTSGDCARSRA